ncbi:trypsin-7-like [Sitophilus oryzae]|uniref:Vitamin K-dependent protein C n=1 Tax=Sitophilus oryzae TaxID=7048 RepID=A0A6J2XKD1_SITOR|nr:trypsin-7-like [Sitophilus oryzae]
MFNLVKCAVLLLLWCFVVAFCEETINAKDTSRQNNIIKNVKRKNSLYKTYGNLIVANDVKDNKILSFKPGDIVMETQVISRPLNLTDPTANSSHKNIIDWFLGVVGFKPEENQPETPQKPVIPNLFCPKCRCGVALKHKRIVGGVETLVNEYPWMVALQYNNRFYCGASLINSKYLLTAAHCVNSLLDDLKIIIANDKSQIDFLGVAVGWGATAQHGHVSTKLREVNVPIISNIDCRKTGYSNRITDNMICAGFPQGQKDSCQGDSGGPLHVINGSIHQIVGIVSWGEGCAQPNYPGVYTRVNRFITWIESNTRDACYC